MRKKNSNFTMVIFVVVFVIGLSLVLYPSVSNYWNSMHQTKAIASYVENVAAISDEEYQALWQAALDYNTHRASAEYKLTDDENDAYNSVLNVDGTGVMGYIEIPSIAVSLPIYHGTSDGILSKAIGHLDWSNLPIGGEGTHCVLSGHRGLPSAKLFTDLDRLVAGDVFLIYVLNETFTYEVDQILIVEPSDLSALNASPGEDLCTLITCTPYGINTHRLLVRGHRIENNPEHVVHVVSEAVQVDEKLVAIAIGAPIIAILFLIAVLRPQKKRKINQ